MKLSHKRKLFVQLTDKEFINVCFWWSIFKPLKMKIFNTCRTKGTSVRFAYDSAKKKDKNLLDK